MRCWMKNTLIFLSWGHPIVPSTIFKIWLKKIQISPNRATMTIDQKWQIRLVETFDFLKIYLVSVFLTFCSCLPELPNSILKIRIRARTLVKSNSLLILSIRKSNIFFSIRKSTAMTAVTLVKENQMETIAPWARRTLYRIRKWGKRWTPRGTRCPWAPVWSFRIPRAS